MSNAIQFLTCLRMPMPRNSHPLKFSGNAWHCKCLLYGWVHAGGTCAAWPRLTAGGIGRARYEKMMKKYR